MMRFTNGESEILEFERQFKKTIDETKSCLFWFMCPERTSTVNFHACRFVGFVQQGSNIHRTVFECAKSVEEDPKEDCSETAQAPNRRMMQMDQRLWKLEP